jgi:hypothetical protein
MDKGYSYFKHLKACEETGCPICHLVTKCSREYLEQLFYESVTDVPTRARLITSFGFCNWHTWQVPALPAICAPDMGFAIFASDLLGKFNLLSDRITAENRRRRPLKSLLTKIRDKLSSLKERPCPACVYIREVESYHLKDLLVFIRDHEFLEVYKASRGICLPHFMYLQEHFFTHPNFPILLGLQRSKAQALRDTLEEFIRKLDHRFQHQLTTEERGAWKVAMEFLGGKPGVFPNEMGRGRR